MDGKVDVSYISEIIDNIESVPLTDINILLNNKKINHLDKKGKLHYYHDLLKDISDVVPTGINFNTFQIYSIKEELKKAYYRLNKNKLKNGELTDKDIALNIKEDLQKINLYSMKDKYVIYKNLKNDNK